VLVVDDSADMAETVAAGLAARGYDAVDLSDADQAAARIALGEHDALVTDLRMPGHDGIDLLERSRAAAPEAPVIIMTAFSGVDTAVESIRRGAYHYITKPFKLDELALFLGRAFDEAATRRDAKVLRRTLRSAFALENMVGDTPAMRDLTELVRRVADTTVPVLVLGETGTGKGLVARALHSESSRADRPFVAVNCAAIPETLLESELFGHAKGAFTGAAASRAGIFEQASGGTLFLDEIGEMSAPLQAKLLHVLETGHVRPLGDTRERAVDVRVVAATHRDLRERVREGSFREDLLYRLDVVSIEIPALRHRSADIPRLAEHFLGALRKKHPSSRAARFSREAMDAMSAYPWPGNVRELEHAIERAVLLAPTEEIGLGDLPKSVTAAGGAPRVEFGHEVVPLRELTRQYVAWAYERCGNNKKVTCEALGIDFKTLVRWLSLDTDG
jgi:two-component system response regulator HydG